MHSVHVEAQRTVSFKIQLLIQVFNGTESNAALLCLFYAIQPRVLKMLQYRLSTLMWFMVGVSMFLAMLVMPSMIAILFVGSFFVIGLPAAIGGAVYLRGYAQAFSVGCLIPFVLFTLASLISDGQGPILFEMVEEVVELFDDPLPQRNSEVNVFSLILVLLVAVSGAVTMAMRWLALRLQQGGVEPQEDDSLD